MIQVIFTHDCELATRFNLESDYGSRSFVLNGPQSFLHPELVIIPQHIRCLNRTYPQYSSIKRHSRLSRESRRAIAPPPQVSKLWAKSEFFGQQQEIIQAEQFFCAPSKRRKSSGKTVFPHDFFGWCSYVKN